MLPLTYDSDLEIEASHDTACIEILSSTQTEICEIEFDGHSSKSHREAASTLFEANACNSSDPLLEPLKSMVRKFRVRLDHGLLEKFSAALSLSA